jgi:hypothetical protein
MWKRGGSQWKGTCILQPSGSCADLVLVRSEDDVVPAPSLSRARASNPSQTDRPSCATLAVLLIIDNHRSSWPERGSWRGRLGAQPLPSFPCLCLRFRHVVNLIAERLANNGIRPDPAGILTPTRCNGTRGTRRGLEKGTGTGKRGRKGSRRDGLHRPHRVRLVSSTPV